MAFDEDDLDEDGYAADLPSSNDDGYCMDDGLDNGCDQFYWENEDDPNDFEEN